MKSKKFVIEGILLLISTFSLGILIFNNIIQAITYLRSDINLSSSLITSIFGAMAYTAATISSDKVPPLTPY